MGIEKTFNILALGSYSPASGGGTAGGLVFKGSVNTYADLANIQNPQVGDMYNVLDTGMNYAWTGSAWDSLGGAVIPPMSGNAGKFLTTNGTIASWASVKTFAPFPSDFVTTGTLQDLADSIENSSSAIEGNAFLGGISGACTPWGSGNAECKVEYMLNGLAVLTVSSSNISPYHWEYNTASGDYIWKKYSDVIANPNGTTSNTLNKISIDGILYNIEQVQQEISTQTVSLDLQNVSNTYYTCTYAGGITSLAISNIPSNNTSITIRFTTGASISVSLPTGTKYFGTLPTWAPNTEYCIDINKGIVVAAEIKTTI